MIVLIKILNSWLFILKYKSELMSDFEQRILPRFQDGSLKPIIEKVFDLANIADAHRFMESNQNIGKILLKVSNDEADKSEL
jgi:NADPH:quinone reductase-like Zn-dependent oxidoreductase